MQAAEGTEQRADIRLRAQLSACGGFLIGLAVLVLVAAYVTLAVHAGSAWLWPVPVHEDGVRTFGDTLLFYEHATRELPLDLILAVIVGAGAAYALPRSPQLDRAAVRGSFWFAALGATLVTLVILFGAARDGWRTVAENLLQNHTRPGAPLEFGSHWRYHLLERLGLIVISVGLAGLLRALIGPRNSSDGTLAGSIVFATLILYAGLTVVFFGGAGAFVRVFHDAQHLGHQAREIITHSVVTLPLAWGACLGLSGRFAAPNPVEVRTGPIIGAVAWLVAGISICLYVLVAAFAADAASHGQSADMVTLVFPHYFEHGFTYLVTPLTAAAVFLGLMLARPRDA